MCYHRKWHNHPHARTLSMYYAGVVSSDTDVSSLFFHQIPFQRGLKPLMPRAKDTFDVHSSNSVSLYNFDLLIQCCCCCCCVSKWISCCCYRMTYIVIHSNSIIYRGRGGGLRDFYQYPCHCWFCLSVYFFYQILSSIQWTMCLKNMPALIRGNDDVKGIWFKWTEAFDSWFYSIHGSQFPPLYGIHGAFTFPL